MRILLIGNYALDKQESMLRFAALMERELKARGHIVRLMQPQARLARSTSGPGKWLGYLDKIVLFPFALKQAIKNFDVVHICDHSNAFYAKYSPTSPTSSLATTSSPSAAHSAKSRKTPSPPPGAGCSA